MGRKGFNPEQARDMSGKWREENTPTMPEAGTPVEDDEGKYHGKNLRNEVFSGMDLHGADFAFSDLRGADFTDCDLRGADFTCANLDGAMLTDANLEGAQFAMTSMNGTNLEGTILAADNVDDAFPDEDGPSWEPMPDAPRAPVRPEPIPGAPVARHGKGKESTVNPVPPRPMPQGPVVASIDQAENFDQIADYMKARYDIDYDNSLSRFSLDTVKTISKGTEDTLNAFPEAGNCVHGLTVVQLESDTLAATHKFSRVIGYSTDFEAMCDDHDRMNREGTKTNLVATGNQRYETAAHETGHAIVSELAFRRRRVEGAAYTDEQVASALAGLDEREAAVSRAKRGRSRSRKADAVLELARYKEATIGENMEVYSRLTANDDICNTAFVASIVTRVGERNAAAMRRDPMGALRSLSHDESISSYANTSTAEWCAEAIADAVSNRDSCQPMSKHTVLALKTMYKDEAYIP